MFISSWEITQSVFWQNTDMDVAGKGGKVRKAWNIIGETPLSFHFSAGNSTEFVDFGRIATAVFSPNFLEQKITLIFCS